MKLDKLGVWFFTDGLSASALAEAAGRVEDLGYSALWIPEATGREALTSASWLLSQTQELVIATGIANVYGRDAMAMAAAQKTLDEQSGGRFLLGIGLSHKPLVEGLRGHKVGKPLPFMKSYLEAMKNALYTAPASDQPSRTVIGALHPKMLKLAAEETDGAHPYLVPPEHTAFAREIMGPDAWICVEQKVLLETDATKARETARAALGLYLGLPNYRRSLKRFGFTDEDLDNGGSDKLVDATVAWGNETAIADRIEAHRAAGATHVCIQPVHPGGLPEPDWRILEAMAPRS